jgi:hypothetical protein
MRDFNETKVTFHAFKYYGDTLIRRSLDGKTINFGTMSADDALREAAAVDTTCWG